MVYLTHQMIKYQVQVTRFLIRDFGGFGSSNYIPELLATRV